MKSFWCSFVILSVLFLSVDGAADTVTKGHAHGDGAAYQLSEDPPDSGTEEFSDHCERCCHGHSTNMTLQAGSEATSLIERDHIARYVAHVRNFLQAPPTPPPNA